MGALGTDPNTLYLHADAQHLSKLHLGAFLVTGGIIAQILAGVMLAAAAVGASVSPSTAGLIIPAAVIAVAAVLTTLAGWWLISERDPSGVLDDKVSRSRPALRVALIVNAVFMLIRFIEILTGTVVMSVSIGSVPIDLGQLLSNVATAVQFFASMLYLRWVAARIPDDKAINDAKRMLWLGPVLYIPGMCILIGPLIALVLYWNLVDRVRRQLKTIRIARGDINAKAPKIPR